MMSFFKNTINVFKTIKKNRDDWSKEIDEKSEQKYYQSMQKNVSDLKEKSAIVTSKDFSYKL